MVLLFKIIAVALVGAAAYFYWIGEQDWLFTSAVLAACSFFLSIRFRIKRDLSSAESTKAADDDGPASD